MPAFASPPDPSSPATPGVPGSDNDRFHFAEASRSEASGGFATSPNPFVEPNLSQERFCIVTHVYGTGPAFELETYVREKVAKLLVIGHPFSFTEDRRSFFRFYANGKLVASAYGPRWSGPDVGFYLKDILLTCWWVLRHGRFDTFVGVGALNAWTGVCLKRLRRVHRLVFYAIDYVPQRFPGRMMNALYHQMERFAIARSGAIWNLSPAMIEAREGTSTSIAEKHVIVPIGTRSEQGGLIPSVPDRHRIVYFGHLRSGQGVERVLAVMPDVIAQVPHAHLLIIGGGPLEPSLRSEIARLKIEDHIRITGFLKEIREAYQLLRTSAVAVAPYADVPENFTRYTDPGKIKDYLASGLPVVITNVPRVAEEIAARGCGIAIPDTPEALAAALTRLLQDDRFWQSCREQAVRMAKDYAWDRVFSRALTETLHVSA